MCGRYSLGVELTIEELQDIINGINRAKNPEATSEQIQWDLKTHGEIFPTNIVPVVTGEGPIAMRWGFAMHDSSRPIINSRVETLLEKPMFRKPALENRCLIPAAFYYEWRDQGQGKIKHKLRPEGNSLIYMAAIARLEKDKPVPVFSIITRAASLNVVAIHDRMPIILPYSAQKDWLSPNAAVLDVLETAILDVKYQPDAPIQTTFFQ